MKMYVLIYYIAFSSVHYTIKINIDKLNKKQRKVTRLIPRLRNKPYEV